MSSEATEALYQRGLLLKEQGRYTDAEECFREAIGLNPESPDLFYHLANTLYRQDKSVLALAVLEEAIRMDPNDSYYFADKSLILASMDKHQEALEMASQALSLDPHSAYAYNTQANAFMGLERWSDMETAARYALSLDPDNGDSSNLLAHALRMQGKMEENSEQIAYSLARDPEDPCTHAIAGWSALQRGDRQQAETHFLEALRLDPNNEQARSGLLESFKARSTFYSAYLKYCFWMQQFSKNMRWAIVIGFVVFIKLANAVLTGPLQVLYWPLLGIYLLFCLWVHVARGVGNLILLKDRLARHALQKGEKWDGVVVGGGIALGLPLLILGFFVPHPATFPLALTLIGMSFPFAYTFTNQSTVGRWLFASIGVYVIGAGLLYTLSVSIPGLIRETLASGLATLAFLATVATTWLSNVKVLSK